MITRTVTTTYSETKMIKIYCPDWEWCAQGFRPETIKGHVFVEEPYDPTKNYDEIYEQAKAEAEANIRDWSYSHDVRKEIYWR